MANINWVEVVFWTFMVSSVLDAVYLGVLRLGMIERPSYLLQKEVQGVSLVVCFKNEAENLKKNLPHWLRQIGVRDWELILVNDGSNDDSLLVIDNLIKGFEEKVKLIHIDPEDKKGRGKKYALLQGVNAAVHEHIVVTDADCLPASNRWMKLMSDKLGRNQLVLGISPIKYHKGFINAFQSWQSLQTLFTYVGMANLKRPYMGVGRNMAFHKSLFLKHNGFEDHYDIPSGDDDLFVNRATRNGAKTIVSFNQESFTYAEPVKGFGKLWRQKTRHMAGGVKYHWLDNLILSQIQLMLLLSWSAFIACLILNISVFKCLTVFILKEVAVFVIFGSLRKFNWRHENFNLSTIYRVLSLLMQILAVLKNVVSPTKKWN